MVKPSQLIEWLESKVTGWGSHAAMLSYGRGVLNGRQKLVGCLGGVLGRGEEMWQVVAEYERVGKKSSDVKADIFKTRRKDASRKRLAGCSLCCYTCERSQ